MNMNSGSLLFFSILMGCLLLLIIALIIIGVIYKKKNKVSPISKAIVVILSLSILTFSVVYPLAHYNYIDVNLKYGYYKDENTNNLIRITRHHAEYVTQSTGEKKEGTWSLKHDNLVIHFEDGTKGYFSVKKFGTRIYSGDHAEFKYLKDKR